MTRMTLSANRGFGQRIPASSVHVEKSSENHRVRTIAPVPAHEDFLASLAAVTSFSLPRWVSEVRAASKSEVRM